MYDISIILNHTKGIMSRKYGEYLKNTDRIKYGEYLVTFRNKHFDFGKEVVDMTGI